MFKNKGINSGVTQDNQLWWGGGGGHEGAHHNFVVVARMIMKFDTCIKLEVFLTTVASL